MTGNSIGSRAIGAASLFGASLVLCSSAAWGQPPEAEPFATDGRAEFVREIEVLTTAEVAPLMPDAALEERHIGKRVRWAGGIYGIDGPCLTILFARSGDYGEPSWSPQPTYQTFVACGSGVYDKELVEAHTNVTIIGEVTGKQYIGMGGGGSDGPTIRIEKLYRWSDCLAGDDSPLCKQGFLIAGPAADE